MTQDCYERNKQRFINSVKISLKNIYIIHQQMFIDVYFQSHARTHTPHTNLQHNFKQS